jgi:hypothetical protein
MLDTRPKGATAMPLAYPENIVWYVRAVIDGNTSEGSAVAIRLQQTVEKSGGRQGDPATARTYLLTCRHVVCGKSADGAEGFGPVAPDIRAWAPGTGFNTPQSKKATLAIDGLYHKHGSDDRRSGAADDWVVLEIIDARAASAAPAVTSWAREDPTGDVHIYGYPGGDASFSEGVVTPTQAPEAFPVRDEFHGSLRLLGDKGRPGVSGGGVFTASGFLFAGIHRARTDATLQLHAVSSQHIRNRLRELNFEVIERRHESVPILPASPDLTRPGLFRYLLDQWFPRFHSFLTNVARTRFPEPPELSVLRTSLAELGAEIAHEFQEKLYIPVWVRGVPEARSRERGNRDPFVAPIHQVILQLAGRPQGGGDSASANIEALSRRSRVVRNVLRSLDRAESPLILLGEPGSGKTMTLQQAARALALQEKERVFPRLVLYVRLGEFHVDGSVTTHDVWNYVRQAAPSTVRSFLESLAYHHRLVIFFDGMDEMSRDQYGAHTEALSRFAGTTGAKTLFSCRITDFSKKFVHRRLVILPFNRSQVAAYLRVYVDSFPITVSSERLTLRALSQKISKGDLPIDPSNPFVLWLLCIYLQENGVWPNSRVELLQFYNERNYERKAEEHSSTEDRTTFPTMKAAFDEWSRFAYVITNRNRGTAIPVDELKKGSNDAEVVKMIEVAKLCGVLETSREGEVPQIRFVHHRLQEFFTAAHIRDNRPAISWLDKFDAPRWQATMVNLVLMEGGGEAVEALTVSVSELLRTHQATIQALTEAKTKESIPNAPQPASTPSSISDSVCLSSEEQETTLADRVELASRMLRECGTGTASVRSELAAVVWPAIEHLADHGNPITQVKMLRACRNLPEVATIGVLRKPLESPVGWVRDQALIVMAESRTGASALGTDLATEMAYDLASGHFLARLPAYVRAAARTRGLAGWWCVAMGVLCFLTNLVFLLAIAGVLYMVAAQQVTWLNDYFWIAGYGAVILIVSGIVFKYEPAKVWIAILTTASASLILLAVIPVFWAIASLIILVGIAFCFAVLVQPIAVVATMVGFIVGVIAQFGSLALFLLVTSACRENRRTVLPSVAVAWQQGGFAEAWEFASEGIISGIAMAIYGFVAIACFFLAAFALGMGSNLIGGFLTTDRVITAIGVLVVVLILGLAIQPIRQSIAERNTGPVFRFVGILAVAVGIILCLAVGGTVAILLWNVVFHNGLGFISWLDSAGAGSYIGRGLVVVTIGLATIALIASMAVLLRSLGGVIFPRPGPYGTGYFTVDEWKRLLGQSDKHGQEQLLLRTNHKTVGLKPSQFLAVLREIEPFIKKEDPAATAYWTLRDQLQEVERQEREG